ncbi:MAG: dolichol kinase [Candidatus Bathyarchaeales archaeon]
MISVEETAATVLLFAWVIFTAYFLTANLYTYMKECGLENNVAVYYDRKVIHILTGGVVATLVPFIFKTPILPFIMAMLLAVFLYIPHKRGKLLYWFQTEDNSYEVSFCIMWGTILTLGWILSEGNFWFGVLPVIFMSVGDAVTGVVRNLLYKKRTKSWWGNLAMATFSIPTGAVLGAAGIMAGAAASFIEHFESHPIDDNITVPLSSFVILLLAKFYAPWLLAI